MDLPPAWCQVCVCGHTFSVLQAYTFHKRSCQKMKKQLSSGLEKAKEVWQSKKHQKMEVMQSTTAESPTDQNVASASMNNEDLDQPLAERRGRRENHQLPKCYRDILPEPPPALPPAPQPEALECTLTTSPATIPASPSSEQPPNAHSHVRRLLKSIQNKFGIFQQYHATHFPGHDLNENITRDDLMDTSPDTFPDHPADSYHPYPNQSSFLLGEWYWNGGLKKTQSGFQDLIKIVGHPNFQPEDVSGTNWQLINAQLSGDQPCNPSNNEGWEDKEDNSGWVRTPIKIKVPFPRRSLHPGQKEFDVGTLHHCKLVSVI
ncbi:hypothetical protein L208DRAFT_1305211, partial [Tricholoma matsutake]